MNTEPLRYPALMDGEEGANGVVFPDLPGCVAMGYTVEDAIVNAEDAIRDYTLDAEQRMAKSCLSRAPSSPSKYLKAVNSSPFLSFESQDDA